MTDQTGPYYSTLVARQRAIIDKWIAESYKGMEHLIKDPADLDRVRNYNAQQYLQGEGWKKMYEDGYRSPNTGRPMEDYDLQKIFGDYLKEKLPEYTPPANGTPKPGSAVKDSVPVSSLPPEALVAANEAAPTETPVAKVDLGEPKQVVASNSVIVPPENQVG